MTLPLVPYPSDVRAARDVRLTEATRILLHGEAAGADIAADLLRRRTGLPLPVFTATSAPQVDAGDIVFADADMPAEAYTIRMNDAIVIAARDAAGRLYAVQTLLQLLQPGDVTLVRGADVDDAPRFGHRGLMLDVARHFFPVKTVLAVIDRALSMKLNRLHLHLTDDQGWRLEIPGLPELTERAASTSSDGDPGGFFTQDDVRRIVTYAAERGIEVIPEIDLPGHTHAVGVAYPDLVAPAQLLDSVRETAEQFGEALPVDHEPFTGKAVGFSSLRMDDDRVWAFLDTVFAGVAAVFPSTWLHVGGDEALGTDPTHFARFISTAAERVIALGKTPVTWHEAGAASTLPAGTIGQYWGFRTPIDGHDERARAFVDRGGRIILSPADAIYLDHKYDADTALGLAWADGPTSVERSYAWAPESVITGIDEADILGVEAALWSETLPDLAAIDTMLFPRLGSAAEKAWTRAGSPEAAWESFRERIAALAPGWTADGFGHHRAEGVDWS